MADTAFSETSRLLTRFHVRKIQRVAQHTLDEIAARFPSHLIDDVNARGLPPDRTLAALDRTPGKLATFKNSNGNHKIYSFD